MRRINYTKFKNNLAKSLDIVNETQEAVMVSRGKDKNAVIMSVKEYNSIQETLHLFSSSRNSTRLDEAKRELNKGKWQTHKLL